MILMDTPKAQRSARCDYAYVNDSNRDVCSRGSLTATRGVSSSPASRGEPDADSDGEGARRESAHLEPARKREPKHHAQDLGSTLSSVEVRGGRSLSSETVAANKEE